MTDDANPSSPPQDASGGPVSGGVPDPSTQQPLDLLADLESRLGQLKAWQSQTEHQVDELKREGDELDRRKGELEAQAQAVEAKRGELEAERASVEEARQQIEAGRAEVERERAELDGAKDAADAIRQEAQDHADRVRAELDERSRQVSSREAEAQAHLDEAAAERSRVEQDLAAERERVESQSAECEKRSRELGERESTLEAEHARLENQKQELEDKRRVLAETAESIERDRAEADETRQLIKQELKQLEVDRTVAAELKDQLTESRKEAEKLRVDLKLRAEAIEDQQARLETARAELAEKASDLAAEASDREDGAASEDREALARSRAEAEALRGELDAKQAELDVKRTELEDQAESLAAREEALSQQADDLADQRDEWESRCRELDTSSDADSVFDQAVMDDRAEALERRSEELDRRAEDLLERESEAERRLADAESEAESIRAAALSDAAEGAMQSGEIDPDRVKAMRDAEASIRARRGKLHRYHKMIRDRGRKLRDAENRVQSAGQQLAGLERERQMLVEVKKFLESSEAQMVQKWATHRAATLVIGVAIAVSAMATVAWFAGQKAVLPVWANTMTLEVRGEAGEDGEPTPGPAPAPFLRDVVLTPAVLSATVEQLDRRDLRPFASPQAMRTAIEPRLAASGEPGEIQLTYRGDQPEVDKAVLEALGRAVVSYQMSMDRKANRPDSTKVTVAADTLEKPVEDKRLEFSAKVFGGGLGALLLLYGLLRLALGKSRRLTGGEASPQLEVLDKPQTWSPLKKRVDSDAA